MATNQYIGARYVPLFADPIDWSSANAYEPLTIVMNAGSTYTSRQYVPQGVDISDASYWLRTADYNAQIAQYRDEVRGYDSRIAVTEETASRAESTANQAVTSVTAESDAREKADSALESKISAETSARESAIEELDNDLTAEVKARTNADSSLESKISAETSARTSADTTLTNGLTSVENVLTREIGVAPSSSTAGYFFITAWECLAGIAVGYNVSVTTTLNTGAVVCVFTTGRRFTDTGTRGLRGTHANHQSGMNATYSGDGHTITLTSEQQDTFEGGNTGNFLIPCNWALE